MHLSMCFRPLTSLLTKIKKYQMNVATCRVESKDTINGRTVHGSALIEIRRDIPKLDVLSAVFSPQDNCGISVHIFYNISHVNSVHSS